jgi:uncharacterized membrane protein
MAQGHGLSKCRVAALSGASKRVQRGGTYCNALCYPCMNKTRKMKIKRAAKKRVARPAKKPTRNAALKAKQHRKQSAAVKRKPVVDPPVVTAAPKGQIMPFLFWTALPLAMMSMWLGTREARQGT